MAASHDLVPVGSKSRIPIAQMRSVFSVAEVERKLAKLPEREHESLRGTYQRMLEKGPQRFQVKPSGLPAMNELYEDLPFRRLQLLQLLQLSCKFLLSLAKLCLERLH
jgi:ATP-dependent Lon protease